MGEINDHDKITRLTLAVIFLRLFNMDEEASKFKGEDNFDDVTSETVEWEQGRNIAAFLYSNQEFGNWWLNEANFGPKNNVTTKELLDLIETMVSAKQGPLMAKRIITSFIKDNIDKSTYEDELTMIDVSAIIRKLYDSKTNGGKYNMISELGIVELED